MDRAPLITVKLSSLPATEICFSTFINEIPGNLHMALSNGVEKGLIKHVAAGIYANGSLLFQERFNKRQVSHIYRHREKMFSSVAGLIISVWICGLLMLSLPASNSSVHEI